MSNRVRSDLLREWRLAQSMDMDVLARKAILSKGQILQLESGETSLFYSQAIQEKAARKVALLLGGDPALVIREDEPGDAADADALAKPSVVDALIELQERQSQTFSSGMRVGPVVWGLGALLLMAGVSVMGISAQFNAANFRPSAEASVKANNPAPPSEPISSSGPQVQAGKAAPQPSAGLLPAQNAAQRPTEFTPKVSRAPAPLAEPVEKPVVLPEVSWTSADPPLETPPSDR